MTLLLTTTGVDVSINPRDWPRCAVCRMPVENFWVVDTSDSIILVAACHGKEQIINVLNETLASMLGSYINFGRAFEEGNEAEEKRN